MVTLCSCGANYHLRKADLHLRKAEMKGARIHTDTTYKKLQFKFPGLEFKTVINPLINKGEVWVPRLDNKGPEQAKVVIKWKERPGEVKCDSTCIETIYVKCPDQEEERDVAVSSTTNIKPPNNKHWWWFIVGLVLGAGATLFLVKTITIQKKQ